MQVGIASIRAAARHRRPCASGFASGSRSFQPVQRQQQRWFTAPDAGASVATSSESANLDPITSTLPRLDVATPSSSSSSSSCPASAEPSPSPSASSTLLDGTGTATATAATPPQATRGKPRPKLPDWFRMQSIYRTPEAKENWKETKATLKDLGLATVCEQAKCPNLNECWGEGTATVMILGDTCTRACRFCSVKTSRRPEGIEAGTKLHDEPTKVADAIAKWEHLKYVVITCVDRDDLMDFGAVHIKKTVENVKKIRRKPVALPGDDEIDFEGGSLSSSAVLGSSSAASSRKPRSITSEVLVETLLGDFRGDLKLVDIVLEGNMDVFAHNIETVDRLNSIVRDRRANYKQSMSVLEHVGNQNEKRLRDGKNPIITKSSIIVGLGETDAEIEQTMRDLRSAGCRAVTLGQYLQPTKKHMRVDRFVPPEVYGEYERMARDMGFDMVASGPMVRSSYRAGELYLTRLIEKDRESQVAAAL